MNKKYSGIILPLPCHKKRHTATIRTDVMMLSTLPRLPSLDDLPEANPISPTHTQRRAILDPAISEYKAYVASRRVQPRTQMQSPPPSVDELHLDLKSISKATWFSYGAKGPRDGQVHFKLS